MIDWIDNIELEGEKVKLIPLKNAHKDELLNAASDGKLWELWFTSVPSSKDIGNYIEHALNQKQKGIEFPFVVLNKKNGEIINSGNHDFLINNCKEYKSLYEKQLK